MDIRRIWRRLSDTVIITEEQRELLERIMTLQNPVEFDEEFATDEQLDALEDALDRAEVEVPHQIQLKQIIENTAPKVADDLEFI